MAAVTMDNPPQILSALGADFVGRLPAGLTLETSDSHPSPVLVVVSDGSNCRAGKWSPLVQHEGDWARIIWHIEDEGLVWYFGFETNRGTVWAYTRLEDLVAQLSEDREERL